MERMHLKQGTAIHRTAFGSSGRLLSSQSIISPLNRAHTHGCTSPNIRSTLLPWDHVLIYSWHVCVYEGESILSAALPSPSNSELREYQDALWPWSSSTVAGNSLESNARIGCEEQKGLQKVHYRTAFSSVRLPCKDSTPLCPHFHLAWELQSQAKHYSSLPISAQ